MCTRSSNRIAAILATATLMWPGMAEAADYGLFIDVETDEDLLDLLRSEEIDEDTYETLVELLNDRVDLNGADREALFTLPNLSYAEVDAIIAYRDQSGGSIADPADLVRAGILTEDKLSAIMPFVIVRERGKKGLPPTHGHVKFRTTWVAPEERVPAMWAGANVSTLNNLDAGVIGVVTRNRLSDVRFDPNRNALSAKGPSVQFNVPKFFVQWEDDRWHAIAGTYRIGFGERLTFDNTGRNTPNGIHADETIYYSQDLAMACRESKGELGASPCSGDEGSSYQSPDYRWTDRLRGVALGLKRLNAGGGWIQAYGFASYQTKGIYQYELFDRGRCPDPRDDKSEACKAPSVFVRSGDPLLPAGAFMYQTLPDMFNELTGGGNLSYFFDRRSHVGVTGYGSKVYWLVRGIDLDFQEWSRLPFGGPFGAVGIDGAWGNRWADVSAEVARSFDGQPEGGGWAGIVRATGSWKRHEIETSFRYYDRDFANPNARPISEPDEYEGLRARDETGARVKYSGAISGLELRAMADFWSPVSRFIPKLGVRVRGDYLVTSWFKPGLWIEYQDKDIRESGRGACFEVADEVAGEPVPCTGEKVVVGAQLRFMPLRNLSLYTKYQHKFVDDSGGGDRFADAFRQDAYVWFVVMYRPFDAIRLRAQVRYLNEDISSRTYLEDSVWAYLEGAWTWRRAMRLKLRYEFYSWLDDRESTAARTPNPAHWLRLEAEYRF